MSQTPQQISEPSSPLTAPRRVALVPLPAHVVQQYTATQEDPPPSPAKKEGPTFINVHGEERSYLELNLGTLQGQYANNQVEQRAIEAKMRDCDPWAFIQEERARPELTDDQVSAINFAQLVTGSVEEMTPGAREHVGEFLDKIMFFYHKGPKDLADAKETMGKITWAQDEVSKRENERANAKRKSRLEANREKAEREAVTNGSARVRKVRKLR